MKKHLSLLLILCLICVFAVGCSDKSTSQTEISIPKAQESPTAAAGSVDADMSKTESNSQKTQEGSTVAAGGVDVDLTVMSSTMVYAEVYNMMDTPDNYLGKTVKMSGPYYTSYYDKTDRHYHFVIIEDATACCQQGLEFIWNGDHIYPDNYPEEKTKIEVVGVFGSYEELGDTYYYLAVDDILILK